MSQKTIRIIILGLAFLGAMALGLDCARPARAGVITVTTSADPVIPDGISMSFREALSITTGVWAGPFSLAEKNQMSGCFFNASSFLTGGCGAGNDTIVFSPTLTRALLLNTLPFIAPAASGLTVDGAVNSGRMIVQGNALTFKIFDVGANDVTIKNLTLINAAYPVYSASGIKHLQILDNFIGALPDSTSCSDPRLTYSFHTIEVQSGAGTGPADGTAYLAGNVVGCSQTMGVLIGGPYAYIGADKNGAWRKNYIGTDAFNHNLGNGLVYPDLGQGIYLGFSSGAVISGNSVAFNHAEGIYLREMTSNQTTNNDIHDNNAAGIFMTNSGLTALTSNTSRANVGPGLWLSGSQTTQNTITGGAYAQNGSAGIVEGAGAAQNSWNAFSAYANLGLSVDKSNDGLPGESGGLMITSVVRGNGVVTISGRLNSAYILTNYLAEVYRAAADPSGYGESKTFIGATSFTANFFGDTLWQVVDPSDIGGCYTAILTITPFGSPPTSYENAQNLCIATQYRVFVPNTTRNQPAAW